MQIISKLLFLQAIDLEDEMITLKEILIKEREEAREEKMHLEEEKVGFEFY
jgi:hypothetical protein